MRNFLSIKPLKVQLILLFLTASILSACGFSLRNKYNLPDNIQQLRLNSQELNSALKRTLAKKLKPFKITILEDSEGQKTEDDMSLYLLSDSLDRRLLSLFSTGQVAEYELVYTVRYQLQFAGQDAQTLEFDVTRDYQDDPNAVLAKSRELDLVMSEMRVEAAERIIRQIAISHTNMVNQAILVN